MAIDLGGGTRGEGGALADSGDAAPTNPIINRTLFDYPIVSLTSDQKLLTPVDIVNASNPLETDQYIIVGAGLDFLFANKFSNGESQDDFVQISVPFTLRKSFWDGKSLNGWDYSFTAYGTRIRENTEFKIKIEEHVWPAYEPGEVITASLSNTADGNLSLVVDNNDAGRSWRPYSPREGLVTAINDDTLTCTAIEDPSIEFEVARPHTLRTSGWDGQTIAGISYAYSGPQSRVASQAGEDDENQLVIPPYIVDQSRIMIAHMNNSYGYGEFATAYYDVNNDGRAWAKEPE
jgi:hypothetical protein